MNKAAATTPRIRMAASITQLKVLMPVYNWEERAIELFLTWTVDGSQSNSKVSEKSIYNVRRNNQVLSILSSNGVWMPCGRG